MIQEMRNYRDGAGRMIQVRVPLDRGEFPEAIGFMHGAIPGIVEMDDEFVIPVDVLPGWDVPSVVRAAFRNYDKAAEIHKPILGKKLQIRAAEIMKLREGMQRELFDPSRMPLVVPGRK